MTLSSPVILQPDYECQKHGKFSIRVKRPEEEVPEKTPCPECGKRCGRAKFILKDSSVGGVTIVKKSWEEEAGELQSTESNKIQAQLAAVKREKEAKKKYGDARCAYTS